ncbi:MAG: maturation of Asn-linked oligosaccharides protein [Claussenomyces sp. TS43310]|nr:MAG: maturation of Asn-linked oligosaccharides protein [Claussenomyces sp. TS43310]
MKFFAEILPVALVLAQGVAATPYRKRQSDLNSTQEQQRAAAVAETFQIAWNGYHQYAFPHDELHPLSNSWGDPRNGWGASAVDGLDTAILMGNTEIVETILNWLPTVDWGNTTESVSLFETTIRYLGGMLSGKSEAARALLASYDLLKGPCANLTSNATAVDALLTQAKSLADHLSFAFDTPTGIPYNGLDVVNKNGTGPTNGLATIGSLVLEWTHLSDLLGDDTYANLTQKAQSYLLNPNYAEGYSSPWPGLLGTNVDIDSGLFQDATGGWDGGDDSYYEYLIKMWVYDQSRFGTYRDAWIQAADSTIEHLGSQPNVRPDLTFLGNYVNSTVYYTSGHLACFAGGNFILAGSTLGEQKYTDFGLQLTAGCEGLYNQTVTGIAPGGFGWSPDGSNIPSDQEDFYNTAGYWMTDKSYILRPEAIESMYYAYRITGDSIYQDWAWNAYLAVNASCAAGSGYAELQDVNTTSLSWNDDQDTFFFAEVLKYAYLIHTPDALYQTDVNGTNSYVFNTEAHLFKVAGVPV